MSTFVHKHGEFRILKRLGPRVSAVDCHLASNNVNCTGVPLFHLLRTEQRRGLTRCSRRTKHTTNYCQCASLALNQRLVNVEGQDVAQPSSRDPCNTTLFDGYPEDPKFCMALATRNTRLQQRTIPYHLHCVGMSRTLCSVRFKCFHDIAPYTHRTFSNSTLRSVSRPPSLPLAPRSTSRQGTISLNPSSSKGSQFKMPMSPEEHENSRRRTEERANELRYKEYHVRRQARERIFRDVAVKFDTSSTLILGLEKDVGYLIQQRCERAWQRYRRYSGIDSISGDLEDAESASHHIQEDFEVIQQQRAVYAACLKEEIQDVFRDARILLEVTEELKMGNGLHQYFNDLLQTIAEGNKAIEDELEHKIEALENELIIDKLWQPISRTGVRIDYQQADYYHSQRQYVFDWVERDDDAIATWLHKLASYRQTFAPAERNVEVDGYSGLGAWGHSFRKLDLASKQYDIFPEIAFPKYWSSKVLFDVDIEWYTANREFRSFIRIVRDGRRGRLDRLKYIESVPRSTNPGDAQDITNMINSFLQLSVIIEEAAIFAGVTDILRKDFKHLIRDGLMSLCPSPYPETHAWQTHNFAVFDRFVADHLQLTTWYSTFCKVFQSLDEAASTWGDYSQTTARKALIQELDGPGQSWVFKSWRRGFKEDADRLRLARSAIHIASTRLKDSEFISSSEVQDLPKNNPQPASTAAGESYTINVAPWPSNKWLEDKSFYPNTQAILVDFVSSVDALYLAIPELRKSKIIGIDIRTITSHARWDLIGKIDYIALATEHQILIIDWRSVTNFHLEEAIDLLRTIVHNEAILKVGSDLDTAKRALRGTLAMELIGYLDINPGSSQRSLGAQGTTFTGTNTLDNLDNGGMETLRKSQPAKFFHALACRPFSALRMFHRQHHSNIIRSAPFQTPIDITEARRSLNADMIAGRADAAFGPIFVDRSKRMFSRISEQTLNGRVHGRLEPSAWLNAICNRIVRERFGWRLSQQDTQALVGYTLLTMFHESLNSITSSLGYAGVQDCAAWILLAAKQYKLRLNDNDRSNLEVESSGSDHGKARANTPEYDRAIRPSRHHERTGQAPRAAKTEGSFAQYTPILSKVPQTFFAESAMRSRFIQPITARRRGKEIRFQPQPPSSSITKHKSEAPTKLAIITRGKPRVASKSARALKISHRRSSVLAHETPSVRASKIGEGVKKDIVRRVRSSGAAHFDQSPAVREPAKLRRKRKVSIGKKMLTQPIDKLGMPMNQFFDGTRESTIPPQPQGGIGI